MQFEMRQRGRFGRIAGYATIGTLAIAACALINPANHYISAVILISSALLSYFYIVIATTDRNWLDLRAMFSLVWLFTIGLASLRLAEYQEQWQCKTWLLLSLAYGVFQIGIVCGETFGNRQLTRLAQSKMFTTWKLDYLRSGNRVFRICVCVTILGMLCFGANIAIRGYLPFFSSDHNSYSQFYTKFYLFAVAATSISGLCYYSLKSQQTETWKKIILYFCIFYSTFLFPILVVSRGTFLTSALSLTAAVFYLNKKRFWILVLCVLIIAGVYAFSSTARGYSNAQLDAFFEPATISIKEEQVDVKRAEDGKALVEKAIGEPARTFILPGKAAFLYSYLTVSHDNFNEAVQNSKRLSYGVRQFSPFNVILRLPLPDIEATYLVRDHLNTYNLIGDAYYDFHEIGVIVSVFIWGFLFGAIQAWYLTGKGPFALLALGNSVSAVALSFFTPWMSNFTHWMHWGTAFLLFLSGCMAFRQKKAKQLSQPKNSVPD